MKRKFLILAFLIISTSAFAQTRLFSASAGFVTGVPFYSSQTINDINSALNGGIRIICGADAAINLNPTEYTTFFAGCDFLSDFNNLSPYYSNHLSVDFPLGIKIYPNIAGLNFGLGYCLGFRTDYYNTEADGKYNENSTWGNGFKLLIEYDFSHNKNRFLPSIGLFLKHMPRGNKTYDNQLCAYINANF